MTLQQLLYFQATARHSYITHAARELYISQPSLSVALKNLEAELGVALFERNGQGIRLTRAGQRFQAHVEQILADVDRAQMEMDQLRRMEDDGFTIGYISPLANGIIVDCIERLAGQPGLDGAALRSLEMTTPQAEEALMDDGVDAALCSRIANNPELTQIPLLEQPLVLIACLDHPLAQRTPERPYTSEDIAAFPFVTYLDGSSMLQPIRRYFQAHPPMPVISHRAGNEETIASLVERGMGLAIVAQTSSVTRQRLAILPLADLEEMRTIYLTWRTHRKRTPQAEAILRMLKQLPE